MIGPESESFLRDLAHKMMGTTGEPVLAPATLSGHPAGQLGSNARDRPWVPHVGLPLHVTVLAALIIFAYLHILILSYVLSSGLLFPK